MARPSDAPAAAHLPAPGAVPAIEARGLTRSYASAAGPVRALRGVDLSVMPGEFVAIMGPSGSGKSTLMNVLGLLDRADAGTYLLEGTDVSSMPDAELARVRAGRIGFVFQSFNLLARETVLDNVCLPLAYAGAPRRERRERAMAAIGAAGLPEGYADHLARELSGGQMQRVAIARALVADPAIVLADEPTGNLDSATGDAVMRTFQALSVAGRTVVLITHHMDEAICADRVIAMDDGKIIADGAPKDVFTKIDLLQSVGLTAPQTTLLLKALDDDGCALPLDALSVDDCAQALLRQISQAKA